MGQGAIFSTRQFTKGSSSRACRTHVCRDIARFERVRELRNLPWVDRSLSLDFARDDGGGRFPFRVVALHAETSLGIRAPSAVDDPSLRTPSSPAPPPAPDPNQKPRRALAAGLALLWGTFTLLAQISCAFDAFDEPLLDWRQSLATQPVPPSEQLALIYIDNIPAEPA